VTGGDPRGLGWDKGQGTRGAQLDLFLPKQRGSCTARHEARDEGRGTGDERREAREAPCSRETSPNGGDQGNQGNQRSRTGVRGGHGHGHWHWRYDCAGQGHPRKLAASCRRLETLSTPAAGCSPCCSSPSILCSTDALHTTLWLLFCRLAAGGAILVLLHPHLHPHPPSNLRPGCLQLTPTPAPTA
jgi:hypothetical protein